MPISNSAVQNEWMMMIMMSQRHIQFAILNKISASIRMIWLKYGKFHLNYLTKVGNPVRRNRQPRAVANFEKYCNAHLSHRKWSRFMAIVYHSFDVIFPVAIIFAVALRKIHNNSHSIAPHISTSIMGQWRPGCCCRISSASSIFIL